MVYDGFWNGVGVVGGSVVAALLLVWVVRRLFAAEQMRIGHDATGNLLAVVGTLYAVLLGLIVVDAMARFERAMDVVQKESNCLADIFIIAQRLPEPQNSRLRELCRDYARQVLQREWPAMRRSKMSVEARTSALAMTRSLDDFEPETEVEKAVFPMLLEEIRDLWDQRRERAGFAEYGIPAIEWAALLIGAGVVLFFAGLFHVENWRLQTLITALTALVIGLNLYLVSLFGYPFAGDLSVSNRPFLLDIAIFEGAYDSGPTHDGEEAAATGPAPRP